MVALPSFGSFSLPDPLERARARFERWLTRGGPRAYADTHDVALDLLAGAPPCRFLDLGAGRGDLSRRLHALGHQVTAVERYVEQFDAPVPLVDADLNATWPFADGSFDAVAAVEILEHLENPRWFFRELSRVLGPRGVAVVSTPNITTLLSKLLFVAVDQWDLFFNHPWRLRDGYSTAVQGHITPLPAWLLAHHARDAGLEVEAFGYSRAWLPGVPWRLNPLPSSAAFGRILLVRLRKR
ncbi:MAG: methyltransferase domain-containing protein [Deltaproteobacteria bacterium]|nr:methyltransferase domain-containing protein [Deltaproteobacteria bacterium]